MLLLKNAVIATMDPARPLAEAAVVASVEAAVAVLAEAAVAALAVGAEKFQSHLTGQKARRFEPTCFFCLRELTKKRRSKAFFAPAWCR